MSTLERVHCQENDSSDRIHSGYRFALIEMSTFWHKVPRLIPLMLFVVLSEAILTTLLRTFTFRPTSDRIVWNLSQILSPSVRSEDEDGDAMDKQGLPVEISLVNGDEGYDDLALQ